jgi:hypothetical protein
MESMLSDNWSEITPPDTIAAKGVTSEEKFKYATQVHTTQISIADGQVLSHPVEGLFLVPQGISAQGHTGGTLILCPLHT